MNICRNLNDIDSSTNEFAQDNHTIILLFFYAKPFAQLYVFITVCLILNKQNHKNNTTSSIKYHALGNTGFVVQVKHATLRL